MSQRLLHNQPLHEIGGTPTSALVCLLVACGAHSSARPPTAQHAPPPLVAPSPEATRAEILHRGCPATYAEALALVGILRETPRPESLGIEVPRDRVVEERPSAPEWPELCGYAEGECRVVRYESGCTDYVELQCGEPPGDAALLVRAPCNRADRP